MFNVMSVHMHAKCPSVHMHAKYTSVHMHAKCASVHMHAKCMYVRTVYMYNLSSNLIRPTLCAGSVLHHYETELTRLRSEYSGLSATKRKELEDLLMEGDLLEVSLDEVQQLWAVLHQDTETLTAFERSGAEEGEGERGGKEEEGRRRRKRKGGGATGSGGSCDGPSGRGKVPPSSKRQKRTTRSTTPKSSPSPVPSNSSSSHSKCG